MSAQKICPTCSTEYPAAERFCPRDGTALRSQSGGTDLVGAVIAERFHVLKKLGEGGMGQVYLAEHVKMGRRSAVKVMHPAMVHDADAISRFNREAANASRINHPNVAAIYDFGETADGLVYLAMEFIEGETLTDLVKTWGALPAHRAAEITRQAAEGLHVAHSMGIVHRDLKPDNIMVSEDRDGLDCVKVVDFGIAKAAGNDAQNVTRTGMVVGTPQYMSPEQLSGDKVDGRSDIYSLAIVAFNMLTGQLPFPADTAQSSMIMRLTERPKSLAEMKPDVAWPADVEVVMNRALERDASLRYPTAREFGRSLFAAIEHMPPDAATAAGTLIMAAPVLGSATIPQQRTGVAGTAMAPSGPPPATGPSAVASAPVAARAGSKAPMLVGGGLIAAAAFGAYLFLGRGGGQNPAPRASPAVASRQGSAPAVAASADSPKAGPPVATPARSAALSEDIARRISLAKENSTSESSAKKALTQTDKLKEDPLTPDERVYIAMIRAQAFGALGKEGRSCQELKDVASISKGTAHEPQFASFIARC